MSEGYKRVGCCRHVASNSGCFRSSLQLHSRKLSAATVPKFPKPTRSRSNESDPRMHIPIRDFGPYSGSFVADHSSGDIDASASSEV
jgi:hypothetical protein